MTQETNTTQHPASNLLVKRWIPVMVFIALIGIGALAFLLNRVTPANSSYAPAGEKAPDQLALAPTATATSVPTGTPAPALTATPLATSTSKPTLAATTTPTSQFNATVNIKGSLAYLRMEPGPNTGQALTLNSSRALTLVGRTEDSSWLFVNTSDGYEGWIKPEMLDLAFTSVDALPVVTPPTSLDFTIKILNESANLRKGPNTTWDKVQSLNYQDTVKLIGRLKDNKWLFVETADGTQGWLASTLVDLNGITLSYLPVQEPPAWIIPTPVYLEGMEGHWIDVDLSDQMLYAFDGTEIVGSFLVSTGLAPYYTERGLYHIDVKFRYDDMAGAGYNLPDVPFVMYYHENFSIHGTYWHRNFGTPMSHGCINMDTKDAEWLYEFAEVGTAVFIHR